MKQNSEPVIGQAFSILGDRTSLGGNKMPFAFQGKNRSPFSFSRITQNPSATGKPIEPPTATPEAYPVFFEGQFFNGKIDVFGGKGFFG